MDPAISHKSPKENCCDTNMTMTVNCHGYSTGTICHSIFCEFLQNLYYAVYLRLKFNIASLALKTLTQVENKIKEAKTNTTPSTQ
jgi:hypothetical protein